MTCKHATTTVIHTTCFTGPVARDANDAAHGGICITEQCATCGSRRRSNVNGVHIEDGAWGPDQAARLVVARAARASARHAIAQIKPVIVEGRDGRSVAVSVDSEGCILLAAAWSSRFSDHDEAAIVRASGVLPLALDARALVIEAELLEEAV